MAAEEEAVQTGQGEPRGYAVVVLRSALPAPHQAGRLRLAHLPQNKRLTPRRQSLPRGMVVLVTRTFRLGVQTPLCGPTLRSEPAFTPLTSTAWQKSVGEA